MRAISPRISGRGSKVRSLISTSQVPKARSSPGTIPICVVGALPVGVGTLGHEIVQVRFHETIRGRDLAGAVTALKRVTFVIDTGRGALAPLRKRAAKVLGRHDMFPLQALSSLRFPFGVIAAAGEVHGLVRVRTATIEGLLVAGIDLGQQLSGFSKGGNLRVLSLHSSSPQQESRQEA